MIVGTSTGGIIAGLAGVKCFPVAECEKMYDNLINKIFIKRPGGGMKLALKQASSGVEGGGEVENAQTRNTYTWCRKQKGQKRGKAGGVYCPLAVVQAVQLDISH